MFAHSARDPRPPIVIGPAAVEESTPSVSDTSKASIAYTLVREDVITLLQ